MSAIRRPLIARSVFLSDLHLGSPNCHAEALVDFLRCLRAQRVYLVGDVIDLGGSARVVRASTDTRRRS